MSKTTRRAAMAMVAAIAMALLVPSAGQANGEEDATVMGRYVRWVEKCKYIDEPIALGLCYQVTEIWEESNGDPGLQTRALCHPSRTRPPCGAGETRVAADDFVMAIDPFGCISTDWAVCRSQVP